MVEKWVPKSPQPPTAKLQRTIKKWVPKKVEVAPLRMANTRPMWQQWRVKVQSTPSTKESLKPSLSISPGMGNRQGRGESQKVSKQATTWAIKGVDQTCEWKFSV